MPTISSSSEFKEALAYFSRAFCTALTSNPTPALCIVTLEAIAKLEWGWNKVSPSETDRTKNGEGDDRPERGGSSGLEDAIVSIVYGSKYEE